MSSGLARKGGTMMTYSASRKKRSSRKRAGRRAPLQILVAGRDHAHVEVDHLFAADPAKRAILERSEQRFLSGRGEISDLVEKDRSAIGRGLDVAAVAFARAGERALFVTEEFAAGQGFGDCAAIDDDQRLFRARAIFMQAARDDLLAGAGLAADDDGIVG